MNLPESAFSESGGADEANKITYFPDQHCIRFVVPALQLVDFPCEYIQRKDSKPDQAPCRLVHKSRYRKPKLDPSEVTVFILNVIHPCSCLHAAIITICNDIKHRIIQY
jgi:hypothetical protein